MSTAVWTNFVRSYWERTPCRLSPSDWEAFVSLDELFTVVTHSIVIKTARLWVTKQTPPASRQDFRLTPYPLFGPQPKERDFQTYFARVHSHITGANVHRLGKAMPELETRTAPFRQQLSCVEDHPTVERWGLDTFFGTYPVSPLGIHKDRASVFTFMLMGERTYCTWPSDYFDRDDKTLHSLDLATITPHLNNAEVTTIKAGEGYYWPSNRWHVILSDGTPSVVAQISAYFNTADLDHWQ